LALQPKILRFVQDKEYERVGDPVPRRADVRLIAATNLDLDRAVKEGRFREDLYYRLAVIPIDIPPLRERPDDVESLALRLLAFHARANHRTFAGFTEDALRLLRDYPWPGNVRELRNVVERATILCRAERIGVEFLPPGLRPVESAPGIGDKVSLEKIEEQHIRRVLASARSLQEAADILGIDQATLWRRRKKYEI
jgi:NtrC-family two-component system response regulator AlgB